MPDLIGRQARMNDGWQAQQHWRFACHIPHEHGGERGHQNHLPDQGPFHDAPARALGVAAPAVPLAKKPHDGVEIACFSGFRTDCLLNRGTARKGTGSRVESEDPDRLVRAIFVALFLWYRNISCLPEVEAFVSRGFY